jgi:hypothetical protein
MAFRYLTLNEKCFIFPKQRGRGSPLLSPILLVIICLAILSSIRRFLIGARRFDEVTRPVLDWILGIPRRGK